MLVCIFQGTGRSIGPQWTSDGPQQEAAAGVWGFPREHQVNRLTEQVSWWSRSAWYQQWMKWQRNWIHWKSIIYYLKLNAKNLIICEDVCKRLRIYHSLLQGGLPAMTNPQSSLRTSSLLISLCLCRHLPSPAFNGSLIRLRNVSWLKMCLNLIRRPWGLVNENHFKHEYNSECIALKVLLCSLTIK